LNFEKRYEFEGLRIKESEKKKESGVCFQWQGWVTVSFTVLAELIWLDQNKLVVTSFCAGGI
jgi:hypothetical protein